MVSHKWFLIRSGVSASQMTEGSQVQASRTSVVIEAHITLLPRSFTASNNVHIDHKQIRRGITMKAMIILSHTDNVERLYNIIYM